MQSQAIINRIQNHGREQTVTISDPALAIFFDGTTATCGYQKQKHSQNL